MPEDGDVQLPDVPDGLPGDDRYATANALHSAALRLLRRAATADGGMSLDGPRASLLSVLVFAGPQPMRRLAEIEQVSPPAITKLVTALQAQNLVIRRPSEKDRRVVLVEATPAGRAILEGGRRERVRLVAGLLAGLSTKDLNTLHRAAEIIAIRLTP
jgi:DNA-binding MarR family transcriptional regulator